MSDNIRWGLDNPHPFSQIKTELIWEGKYDEYGNRRAVDIAGCAMPLQTTETIDEPASRAMVHALLFEQVKVHHKAKTKLFFYTLRNNLSGLCHRVSTLYGNEK